MRDDDDRTAVVGQPAKLAHHVTVQRRIQAGRRLVQAEQRRFGQQLERHRRPFALATGERVDALVRTLAEAEHRDDLVHARMPLLARHVVGEAKRGGETQRGTHGQLPMQDVVLRHHADAVAEFGVLVIKVSAVVGDLALIRGPQPGDRLDQGRLSATAGADHADQRPFLDRERDVVEQRVLADLHGQVVGVERGRSAVHELMQAAVVEDQVVPPDREPVAVGQRCLLNPVAVDVQADRAAEFVHVPRVADAVYLGVEVGCPQVRQDDVVVVVSPDPQHIFGAMHGIRFARLGRRGSEQRRRVSHSDIITDFRSFGQSVKPASNTRVTVRCCTPLRLRAASRPRRAPDIVASAYHSAPDVSPEW